MFETGEQVMIVLYNFRGNIVGREDYLGDDMVKIW